MTNWNGIAEKIAAIIREKKPTNLTTSLIDGVLYIYTDEGLVEKVELKKKESDESETTDEGVGETDEASVEAGQPLEVAHEEVVEEKKKRRV